MTNDLQIQLYKCFNRIKDIWDQVENENKSCELAKRDRTEKTEVCKAFSRKIILP